MAAHGLSRQGDQNAVGGKLQRGAKHVYCNGKPVALHTSPVTPHTPALGYQHSGSRTTDGSANVYIENCHPVRVTSSTTCGHKIIQGSGNVFVP